MWFEWDKSWEGTYYYKDGSYYHWMWSNWEKNWHGKFVSPEWIRTYDWEWSNWQEHWHGVEEKISSEWKIIYDWNRCEWKINGEWIMTYPNWDTYDWLFINWIPFHRAFNEQQHNYTVWWDMPTKIEWHWRYTHSSWKFHEYSVTNWTLTERSRDFISMYDDHKPNENRWSKRGELVFSKKFESDNKISYSLKSWWVGPIKWELTEKWNYEFKSKTSTLSIPKTDNISRENWFWEKSSMHVANIINFCMANAREHGTYKFDWEGGKLQAKQSSPHWAYVLKADPEWSSVWWTPPLTAEYDENAIDYLKKYIRDTDILKNVPKHFGWISAKELAIWLNSCL